MSGCTVGSTRSERLVSSSRAQLQRRSAAGVTPRILSFTFDAMDRPEQTDVAFFEVQTGNAIGDGFATTTTAYNGLSQVTRVLINAV